MYFIKCEREHSSMNVIVFSTVLRTVEIWNRYFNNMNHVDYDMITITNKFNREILDKYIDKIASDDIEIVSLYLQTLHNEVGLLGPDFSIKGLEETKTFDPLTNTFKVVNPNKIVKSRRNKGV